MLTLYGDRRGAVYTMATVMYLTGLFLCKKAPSTLLLSNVLVGVIPKKLLFYRTIDVFSNNFHLIYYNLHKT